MRTPADCACLFSSVKGRLCCLIPHCACHSMQLAPVRRDAQQALQSTRNSMLTMGRYTPSTRVVAAFNLAAQSQRWGSFRESEVGHSFSKPVVTISQHHPLALACSRQLQQSISSRSYRRRSRLQRIALYVRADYVLPPSDG
jgi:hypothetical protein